MSYDVYLTMNTGKEDRRIVECGNYTSNVSGMWFEALGGQRLSALDGKQAAEVIDVLRAAIADLEARPEHYRPMEPSNGWGNYEGAIEFLQDILTACEDNPLARLDMSY